MPNAAGMTASDSFLRIVSARLRKSEVGATALEYGLIAGIIAIGIIGALTLTRQSLRTQYDCVATRLDSAGAAVCATGAPPSGLNLGLEAARAQALLPAGAQILANGLFYDSAGGTGYAATIQPSTTTPGAQTVSVTNTATGQRIAIDLQAIAAGVYELSLAILNAIGPGAADLGGTPGFIGVIYVVADSAGVPRLYYGARPA